MWLLSFCMQILYHTPHTSLALSLTCSLRLAPALACSLKRRASTSGSPSSSSSGSHHIQAEEILRCLDLLQGGLTSWLLIFLQGVGVYMCSAGVEGGGDNFWSVPPGMTAGLQL